MLHVHWWTSKDLLAMTLGCCSYRNDDDRMVILRCFGSEGFYLERVIFPFEVLNFIAPPQGEVEIWSHSIGSPELVSTYSIAELTSTEPAELANSWKAIQFRSVEHRGLAQPSSRWTYRSNSMTWGHSKYCYPAKDECARYVKRLMNNALLEKLK